jgi:RNA polymerase sigma-70 factor, ECF subfamily
LLENDFELVEKTISGDLVAFDNLMKKYEKLVYKVAFGFGKSKENALDISQNVFLKSYQKISSFSGKSSFKTWLVKIAYNEGVNWVRSNQRYLKHSSFETEEEIPTPVVSSADEFLAKEHKSELIKSLYNLNTRYRLAVVLRYFEDQSIKEIAEILECSEGVVKNILFRSLKKLKENLQGYA